jgi:hypothetical protein
MSWSNWKNIEIKSNYYGCAVYQTRLVDGSGKVISIDRFLRNDKDGIISIGKTKNMEERRRDFLRGINKGSSHSSANLFYLMKNNCHNFKKKYRNFQIQYRFKVVSDKNLEKEEEKLIKDYFKKFGELPLLNSSIPNKYDNWK